MNLLFQLQMHLLQQILMFFKFLIQVIFFIFFKKKIITFSQKKKTIETPLEPVSLQSSTIDAWYSQESVFKLPKVNQYFWYFNVFFLKKNIILIVYNHCSIDWTFFCDVFGTWSCKWFVACSCSWSIARITLWCKIGWIILFIIWNISWVREFNFLKNLLFLLFQFEKKKTELKLLLKDIQKDCLICLKLFLVLFSSQMNLLNDLELFEMQWCVI